MKLKWNKNALTRIVVGTLLLLVAGAFSTAWNGAGPLGGAWVWLTARAWSGAFTITSILGLEGRATLDIAWHWALVAMACWIAVVAAVGVFLIGIGAQKLRQVCTS